MSKDKYLSWAAAAGLALSLTSVVPAFAATQPSGSGEGKVGMHGGAMMRPGMGFGVFGTVTAVNGTTLTVTGKARPNVTTASSTVYAVDASNAKVMKNGTSSTVSSIATGDMVMVQGTVIGTNITATVIRDGIGMMEERGMPEDGKMGFVHGTSSTPPISPIQGNGQPVVGGNIVGINGTMVTVTNASNVTYTVDASGAKIVKNGTTTTISALATGDGVVVQGTVNGTSIVASSILGQGSGNQGRGTTTSTASEDSHPGFFGSIGNFFKHIFGF